MNDITKIQESLSRFDKNVSEELRSKMSHSLLNNGINHITLNQDQGRRFINLRELIAMWLNVGNSLTDDQILWLCRDMDPEANLDLFITYYLTMRRNMAKMHRFMGKPDDSTRKRIRELEEQRTKIEKEISRCQIKMWSDSEDVKVGSVIADAYNLFKVQELNHAVKVKYMDNNNMIKIYDPSGYVKISD